HAHPVEGYFDSVRHEKAHEILVQPLPPMREVRGDNAGRVSDCAAAAKLCRSSHDSGRAEVPAIAVNTSVGAIQQCDIQRHPIAQPIHRFTWIRSGVMSIENRLAIAANSQQARAFDVLRRHGPDFLTARGCEMIARLELPIRKRQRMRILAERVPNLLNY